MARPIDRQRKRLAELKQEVTRRGFDRHASVLQEFSELPAELQSAAVMALTAHTPIQSIVVFPPQIQRGWNYVPKQALLFTASGVIHLLASIWPGQEPQITCIEGCGLMYTKVTLLLLYGLLEIVAQGQSSPTRLAMEFNTVSWHWLSRPLQQLLQKTRDRHRAPAGPGLYSPTSQSFIEKLPFKFSNGIRLYGLLPGEELEELVFQPALWERWLYFFRRPVLANTLLLLTTNYMVVIQEELGLELGWLISYIPRNCITGIQMQPSGVWEQLSVQLKRNDQAAVYNLTLKHDAVESWHRQWIQHGGQWQDLATLPV
jgi:hypothetical protein